MNDIKKLLHEQFNLNADTIRLFYQSANSMIYEIKSEKGNYLMKMFPDRFDKKKIENETVICNYLRRHNFPSASFLRSKEKKTISILRGKVFHVQEKLPGEVIKHNELNNSQLLAMGNAYGKLVMNLRQIKTIKYPPVFNQNWLKNYNINACRKKIMGFLNEAHKNNEIWEREQVIKDLEYRLELIDALDIDKIINIPINNMTSSLTHGDYSNIQLLYNENDLAGVVDFSTSCNMLVTWEIIRSFTLGDNKSYDGSINLDSLSDYLDSVMQYINLNSYDLRYMFKIYFLQLLKSTYGYRQILENDTSSNNELTDLFCFNLWRTNMLRFLNDNMDDYSEKLVLCHK